MSILLPRLEMGTDIQICKPFAEPLDQLKNRQKGNRLTRHDSKNQLSHEQPNFSTKVAFWSTLLLLRMCTTYFCCISPSSWLLIEYDWAQTWDIGSLTPNKHLPIPDFRLQMCMHSFNLLHAQFLNLKYDTYISTHVSNTIFKFRLSCLSVFLDTGNVVSMRRSGSDLTHAKHFVGIDITLPTKFVLSWSNCFLAVAWQ